MIVADTSALVSIAAIDLLDTFLTEFETHATETVVEELEDTAQYDDRHGRATDHVLENLDAVPVHRVDDGFESSRVDAGEGSCALLTTELDAPFLITDDLRALPELQNLVDAEVAISPIVLKALVRRNVLEQEEALEKLDRVAANRDWLGTPIYRRAQNLFD